MNLLQTLWNRLVSLLKKQEDCCEDECKPAEDCCDHEECEE